MVGLAIVIAGLVMVFWPRLTGRWVMVGGVPLQRMGWWVIAMGWVVLIYILVTRTLYHRRRMRGPA